MGFMESILSVFRTFGIDIYLKHYCTIQISLIFFILPSKVHRVVLYGVRYLESS
jgi:hypothetical protein